MAAEDQVLIGVEHVAHFTTAGGHLGENPTDAGHRHRNHDGDLPVQHPRHRRDRSALLQHERPPPPPSTRTR